MLQTEQKAEAKQLAEEVVRLAQLVSKLMVERSGMSNRGGPLRPQIAKEFNLSRYAGYDEFIKVISERKKMVRIQLNKL